MNELIPVKTNDNQEPIISARDLHKFLEVGTDFRHWFPRMTEYGFSENVDYTPVIFDHPQNGQLTMDFALKLDMAKEISMIQRNDKGKEARQYFIQVEKEFNSPERIMARALRIADETINNYKALTAEMKPKADFFDAVADSKSAIELGTAANVLGIKGMGRNKLFWTLREKKILKDNNEPYREYIDRGYFRTIEQKYSKPDGTICISIKTLVYQRGLDYIRKIIQEN